MHVLQRKVKRCQINLKANMQTFWTIFGEYMYLIINGCFCCRDLELLGFYTTVKGYMKKSKIYIVLKFSSFILQVSIKLHC